MLDPSVEGLDTLLRPTPVVVDDPSLRPPGTSGDVLLEPGSSAWFRAALLDARRAARSARPLRGLADRRRLGSRRVVPVVRGADRAAGLVLTYGLAATHSLPASQNGRKSQNRHCGPGVGSNAAAPIPRSHSPMRSSDALDVVHGVGAFLAGPQVEVRQLQVLRGLPPDLDARQRVQIQLDPGERVVVRRHLPRLPIDDLPGSVRQAVDRVDPSLDRDALQRQEERSLREERDHLAEAALHERLPEILVPAGGAGELLDGHVGFVLDLQQRGLPARLHLDPAVDLGADPGARAGEPRERADGGPVVELRAPRVADQPADRHGGRVEPVVRPPPPPALADAWPAYGARPTPPRTRRARPRTGPRATRPRRRRVRAPRARSGASPRGTARRGRRDAPAPATA